MGGGQGQLAMGYMADMGYMGDMGDEGGSGLGSCSPTGTAMGRGE